MKLGQKVAIVVGLALVLLIAFGAVASPPPLPSSFYGTLGTSGFTVPAGTKVSAWIGGVKLAEAPVFTADGATAFVIDVPGDILETAAVEGGREGQTIAFKAGGAPAPQTALWHTGNYERRDLTVAAGADLAVSVDDGQDSAVPGTLLTYTLTVRNLGTQTASGITLRDTLPSTVTADSLDGGTLQGSTITWPAFNLEAGASSTRTVTVLVNLNLPVETEAILNDASVAHDGSQGLDPNSANDSDQDSDELRRVPDFAIAESDLVVTPAKPLPGNTVTVNLTVHNSGFKEATGLVVIYNGPPYSGAVVGSRTITLAKQGAQTLTFSFTAGASTVVVSAAVDPQDVIDEVSEGNNTARRFLSDVADLAIGIDNFLFTPTKPRAGDAVAMKVTVRNGGRLAATNVPVEIFDGEPGFGGVSIFSGTIPSILPGGNQTLSFSWTATEGEHHLTAVADLADTILEMFEDNNQAARDLRVPRAAGPDLTVGGVDVSGLTQSPLTLVAGGTVRAMIGNTGDAAAATPFDARLFEDRDGDGRFSAGDRELARQAIPAGLAAGGSATASFSVQGALEFYHPVLWVEADPDGGVAELKEDNNLASCFGVCEVPVPTAPSAAPTVEEWYLPGIEVESAPMVGQLTDDNGDGRIDSRDVPDVVFQADEKAGPAVMARSGLDGTEIWTFRSTTTDPLSSRLAHVALADLDGDGVTEVIAVGRNGTLIALDHHGQWLWRSDPVEGLTFRWFGGPSVADLTGDGVPEIVVGRTVLSNTGKLIAKGTADRGRNYWWYSPFGYPLHGRADDQAHSIVADVDLDGRPEISAGGTLYRLQGNQLVTVWEREVPDNLMPDGFTAVANLDTDPQAEIVYVSSGLVMVLNHDGSIAVNYRRLIPLSPLIQPNGWSGPPTIADLDGDGKPEILVAGATELVAMRSGLATYWRAPVFDVDAQTAATVFDLNGDGKPEVLYADQDNFYVLNGQTGAKLYTRHLTSKTANEYPVVADVDNDGQAEILVPSTTSFGDDDATTRGLHVLGNPGWQGTRPIWNQYSYHITNVQLDGTVPALETPSWQAANTYRVNESQASRPHPRPNATVSLPRVGAPESSGAPVRLRVGNGGLGVLPAGVAVVLYAGDPAQNRVAAETRTTVALQPGQWQDLKVYWQQPGPAGAPATAVVDPLGLVEECDEADNSVGFGITETVLPDLAVPAGGLTVAAGPVAGQKVTVNVKVENRGSAQAPASLIRLYDGPPSLGAQVGEAVLPAIAPGANVTVPVLWETLGAAGAHTVYAVADGADTVIELDEENNQGSVAATLAAAAKPDPAAERLVIDPAAATVGTPVRLALDVANRGTALASGVVVAFRVNNAEVARVTSAAPLEPGGRRTVEYLLQTLSLSGRQQIEARIDPAGAIAEQNEGNNSLSGTLDLASPGATAVISTERVSYASNDTATLTVKIQNSTAAAKDLAVRITIQNASGAVVATVADQTASYPPGTTTTSYTWGTGATPAGAYAAVAEVTQGGTVVARVSSPFSIQGDRSASAQIFADRDSYEPTQSAALTGRVRNSGVNQSLTNLQAKITAAGPTGAVVFTATQAIALLSPGAEASADAVWPIANAAPGLYTVRLEVRDNGGAGALLAFTSIGVTVLDSSQTGAGLSADLTVSPNMVGSGGLLLARFTARNGGNADMSALRLRLRLVRTSDDETVAMEEIPWPLTRNQQREGSLGLSTAGFQEGEHVAILEGLLPGGDLGLGRASFLVLRGVSVADARVAEGDDGAGTAQAVFEVTLSSAAPQEVTVDYATADGTAVAGGDYETATGTLTFQPGETRKTVAVDVHGDTVPESEEVFLLTLGNPAGAALGDGQALGAIADEEGCPSPDLLADGGAETGVADSDLPGWTAAAGTWKRRFADPVPLDGLASLAAGGTGAAELSQDVDLSPYAARIDAGSQEFLFEGFVQSAAGTAPDGARVIVEYRDAANASALATFDSGEIVSAGAWKAVVHGRTVPAGTRWARVRIQGLDHGAAGTDTFFDRLGLRSLGIATLSVTGPAVVEGNAGTVAARFGLQLSCAAPAALDVAYATANGTASAGNDYDAASGTVTFAPGADARTVDVAVRGDLVDEADETFFLDLTGGSGMVVLDHRSTASIEDDDGPVALSAGDAYVDEGDAGTAEARFTVSLPAPSGKTVKVNYATVAGTALAGQDFTAVTGTLTFAPGVESLTVAVPVKGDRVDESDESFTLRLSSPINASIADADGAGTILDDDQAALSIADAAVLEGNGEVVNLVFPVTLSVPADREVRVNYATVNGTAVAGTDYQAATGTLTFAPGTATATVSVRVLGNRTVQLDRVLRVRLDTPQVAVLGDPEGDGTIRDDDGVLISLGSDVTVKEGDSGTVNASLTVTVTNNNLKTVTVVYSTSNGTAASPGDFTAVTNTLSFPPGTSLRTITVPVVGDLVEETPLETFQVVLSSPSEGTLQRPAATVTVIDNDGWVLNGTPNFTDYPGCIFLTRSSSGASAWKKQPIDLSRSFDHTYQVYVGDNDSAADGVIFTLQSMGLSAVGNFGGYLGYEGVTPSAGVEIDTYQNPWDPVSYDHIAVDLNGHVTHEGYPPVQASATSANVEDGQRHDLRVVWNATSKTLDVHFDGSERLITARDLVGQIFGNNPSVYYGFTSGSGISNTHYFCPTVQCADASQPAQVSVGDARMQEGNAGTSSMVFPVTLSCPRTQPVTVSFATANGTAQAGSDYTATAGSVTFQPGETSKDVAVPVFGDVAVEADESFTLSLLEATNAVTRYAQATGTIVTEDAGLLLPEQRMVEGNGTVDFLFDLVLTSPLTVPVSFNLASADGTALAGSDYAAFSGSFTFLPGETRKTLTVRLLGDTAVEPDETFKLRFTNVVNANIPAEMTLTLVDDDDCPTPNLLRDGEGEDALVDGELPGWTEVLGTKWTRQAASCCAVLFPAAVQGTFFIYPGPPTVPVLNELRQDVDVSSYARPIDDGLQRFAFIGFLRTYPEDPPDAGRLVLEYRDATNTQVLASVDTGLVTPTTGWLRVSDGRTAPAGTRFIRVRLIGERRYTGDNYTDSYFDALSLVALKIPGLRIEDASVAEGNSGVKTLDFPVTLTCPGTQPITVNYLTADGTATAGIDYQAAFGTLTFTPGQVASKVSVTIVGDVFTEGNETFSVKLASPVNAGIVRTPATGTIQEDESAASIAGTSVLEGNDGKTTPSDFTVTLSKASDLPVSIDWTTVDGTATAGSDYTAASGTLQFDPGQTTKTISVTVLGDTVPEPDETFLVRLSNPSLVTLAVAEAVGTIAQDDLSIAIGDASVLEGNSGTVPALFKVTLSQASSSQVTVNYTTQDRSATAPQDYTANLNGKVIFLPGETVKTISILVKGDTLAETGENFSILLSGAVNAFILAGEGTGSIIDDDDCPSPNLLKNGGAEDALVNNEIPGWTEAAGTSWTRGPATLGNAGFYPGASVTDAELRQDVDVSVYASPVDAGIQRFSFVGWMNINGKTPSDQPRVIVEYRDAGNQNVLGSYDSGVPTTKSVWLQTVALSAAPPGTRWIRVRLVAHRAATSGNLDVYFDGFELRSLTTPVLTIPDVAVTEGNAGTKTATFPVTLSCAQTVPVTVDYDTTEAGAEQGLDYTPVSGRLTFQPGQTVLNVPVTLFGDTRIELDEQFVIELRNSSGPLLLIPRGTGTITDDDRLPSVGVTGTIRDFNDTHPDFEKEIVADRGILKPLLGPDKKPVYASATRTPSTHGKEAFDQWYRDVAGVNLAIPYTITLTPTADPRVYKYSNGQFFPIDNQLLGNQGRGRNFHFTFELHSKFLYGGHELLRFHNDDDTWVFINGILALDLGGVQADTEGLINLDAQAAALGIVPGQVYDFDLFHAERHTTGSIFEMETSLAFSTVDAGVLQLGAPTYEVTENGTFATISVLRTRGDNGEVSVTYGTANGTATAPGDYTAATGTFTFRDGERGPKTFTIPIADDSTVEPAETVNLILSNPTGGAELGQATAVLTILDDDARPSLAATKRDTLVQDLNGDGQASPGDRLRYEIRIANTGTGPAAGVVLTDAVPANTHLVAGSIVASQGSATATAPVTVAVGSLAPGVTATVSFDVTVDDPLTAGVVTIANQGRITGTGITELMTDDPDTTAPGDATVTPVTSKPELVATKAATLTADNDGDGRPSPGDVLRYEIRIENRGSGRATSVVLDDPAPSHAAVVAGSLTASQGTIDTESPVKVSLGDLAAGASATVRFDVRIASPLPAGVKEIRNQGMVASHELPTVLTDDPALGGANDATVTAITAAPVIVAEKTAALAVDGDADGNGVPSPGDTIEYLVTVRNRGNTSATAVAVDDPVPAHTSLVAGSVSASQGTVVATAPSVRVTLGEIAGGESATVRFRVRVSSPIPAGIREVSNQAMVTSAELASVKTDDPTVGGTADPTVTRITAAPVLAVEKKAMLAEDRDGDSVTSPGDTLLYRVTIANRGNTPATEVTLRDVIDVDTMIESGSLQVSQGSIVSEQPVEATFSEIGAGETATATFRVTVDAAFPTDRTEVVNQARVTSHELSEVVSDDPETTAPGDATRTPVFLTPSASIDDATVSEGAGTASLAVRLAFASNREVRIGYATASGSATAGVDFTAAGGTLVFAPGETTKTIAVPIADDLLDETDETFTVTLTNPVRAVLADGEAVVTITDDDAAPVAAVSSASVSESAGTAELTVTLSAPTGLEVRVDYATSNGTALAGADYTAATGTLVFPAGATSLTVAIPIINDTLDEEDETLQVGLSNVVNATVGSVGTVAITDDDEAPAISVASVSVSEGAGAADLTVTLSAPSGLEVRVNYATSNGTALAGADYTASSGTLVFPAGTTSLTVAIPIINDALDEEDETFQVGLLNAINATAGSAGTVTIEDDDEAPLVSVASLSVPESVGTAGVTVTLSAPSGLEVRVNYATSNGTALAGADYTASSGTLVFPAGATSLTVAIPIINDTLDEEDETFQVGLSNTVNSTVGSVGTVTIEDDDESPVVSVANLSVLEGAGTANLTATLSALSGLEVRVNYATSNGTSLAGADYTASSGTLVFPAGATSLTVAIPIINDTLDEEDETFQVSLSNAVNATVGNAGTVTIADDDESPVVSVAHLSVPEGAGTANLTATLSAPSGREVRIDYSTADGTAVAGADYTAKSGTLVFPAGTTSLTVSVLITNDALDEEDETLQIVLSNAVHVTAGSAATVTITDDDETPSISVASLSVPEAAGTTELTATLSAPSGREVRIDYSTADGTAVAGADYTAKSGTLVFAAGTTSLTVSVPITNDALDEEDETLQVVLSNAVHATVGSAGTVTITDDDETPSISVASLSVPEAAGTAELTATLSAPSGREVRINYATADGTAVAGADYTAKSGTLVFPAGTTSLTVSVSITNDVLDEDDETLQVVLSNAVHATVGSAGTVTIADDDETPSISVASLSVPEGAGTAELTATLSAPSGREVRIDYSTADGTAVVGADYTSKSGTLVFPAGTTSLTVSVPITNDALDEDDETFQVALSNAINATAGSAGTVTITDDDELPSISVANLSVQEGAGTAQLTATLSAPSGREVRIDYSTADGTAVAGADYTSKSGTLVFPAGTTSLPVSVPVTNDVLDEDDETLQVVLSNAVHATAGSAGTVTITDDDGVPSLSISDLSLNEGDAETTAELTVTLSAVSGREVKADFTTSDGTATAGSDYVATAGTVTIPAGSLTATVQIQIVGDEVDETDETFHVTLSSPVAAALDDAEGEVTLLDDDESRATIDDVRVTEGNQGTADAVFTVRLTAPSDREIRIDYATVADTATEGTDYQAAAGTLTFAPGETRKNFTVKVIGDSLLEGDETFLVDLSNAVGVGIDDGRGTGTIVDDEACLSPNLLANPGAEQSAQSIGTVPGWRVVTGTEWQTRSINPLPAEGTAYFYAGKSALAELAQDINVSAYANRIATGGVLFAFEGRLRTLDETPPDTARIVVEYRDAANAVVLDAFDTGEIANPFTWRRIADTRPAPVGTGWIRVRLLTGQFHGPSTDGWFDGLSLRSQGVATMTISDVTVYEGTSGTRDALFNVTLSCPVAGQVSVPHATANGTALAGSDYVAVSGTLTFPSGATQRTIAVPVIGDAIHERHETFTVQLGASSSGMAVVLDPVGLGTIVNDDFCARSPGFWKTHTEVWPLQSLVIGSHRYSATEMSTFLGYNGPDASLHLARQLVATRLNLAVGSNPSIVPVADASDAFLAVFAPGSNPSGANLTQADGLKNQLDAYNNSGCQQVPVVPAN